MTRWYKDGKGMEKCPRSKTLNTRTLLLSSYLSSYEEEDGWGWAVSSVLTSLIAQLPPSPIITIKTEKNCFGWGGEGEYCPKAPFCHHLKKKGGKVYKIGKGTPCTTILIHSIILWHNNLCPTKTTTHWMNESLEFSLSSTQQTYKVRQWPKKKTI